MSTVSALYMVKVRFWVRVRVKLLLGLVDIRRRRHECNGHVLFNRTPNFCQKIRCLGYVTFA